MLLMSNIYGHGFDRCQLEVLEALGFTMRPQVSTYMGSQICHFIDFHTGPCLELIEVEDQQAYRDFVPEGMVPYCPGISLVAPGRPGHALADYARRFFALEPYPLHVSYDGSPDPHAPGWHYLNFKNPPVPGTFLWLTAYDESRPSHAVHPDHPNGVTGVVGLVFNLVPAALERLSRLVDEPVVDGLLAVGDVAVIANHREDNPLTGSDKAFPLRAVVLRASSLDAFAAHADAVKAVTFMARPAVLIETNPLAWDLLVTA